MSTSLNLTKKYLRSVKADPALAARVGFMPNGKLNRSSPLSAYVPRETRVTKKILSKTPSSTRPGVTVGKAQRIGPWKIQPDGGIALNRRNAAIHEIGHAIDHDALKNVHTVPTMIRNAFSPQRAVKEAVGRERVANKNAIQRLRKVGATDQDVAGYRNEAKKGFNTYRKQAIRTHASKGLIPDMLTGRKAAAARKVQIVTGHPMTLTETKNVLREQPYLRGYGFHQVMERLREMSERIDRVLEFSYSGSRVSG